MVYDKKYSLLFNEIPKDWFVAFPSVETKICKFLMFYGFAWHW